MNAIALLLLMVCWVPDSLAAKKDALSELTPLILQCRNTSQISICRRALSLTEVLQRQAESNGDYACQSRLLGLGAALLMTSIDAKQKVLLLPMLKEVKMLCKGL